MEAIPAASEFVPQLNAIMQLFGRDDDLLSEMREIINELKRLQAE